MEQKRYGYLSRTRGEICGITGKTLVENGLSVKFLGKEGENRQKQNCCVTVSVSAFVPVYEDCALVRSLPLWWLSCLTFESYWWWDRSSHLQLTHAGCVVTYPIRLIHFKKKNGWFAPCCYICGVQRQKTGDKLTREATRRGAIGWYHQNFSSVQ